MLHVTEVSATREFEIDCNYNKLWSSIKLLKLLKYLNELFLNVIPREPFILAWSKLMLRLFIPGFFLPLIKFIGIALQNSLRNSHDLNLTIID